MIVFAWFALMFVIIVFGLAFVSGVIWLKFKEHRLAKKTEKNNKTTLANNLS